MLLINFIRVVLTGIGLLVLLQFKDADAVLLGVMFVVVMTLVFTLGDWIEFKLVELFNPETKLEG